MPLPPNQQFINTVFQSIAHPFSLSKTHLVPSFPSFPSLDSRVNHLFPCITTPSPLPSPLLLVKLISSPIPLKLWMWVGKKWKQHDNADWFHFKFITIHLLWDLRMSLQSFSISLVLLLYKYPLEHCHYFSFLLRTLILPPIPHSVDYFMFNFSDKTEKS